MTEMGGGGVGADLLHCWHCTTMTRDSSRVTSSSSASMTLDNKCEQFRTGRAQPPVGQCKSVNCISFSQFLLLICTSVLSLLSFLFIACSRSHLGDVPHGATQVGCICLFTRKLNVVAS